MDVHFEVCPQCKAHGRIVFSDGSESRDVWTRDMGYEEILRHEDAGNLTDMEAKALGQQIQASGLPKTRAEVTHSDTVCPVMVEKIHDLDWRRQMGLLK